MRSQLPASSMKCVVTMMVVPSAASVVMRRQKARRASGSDATCRLVEKENLGAMYQGRGHGQPPFETAGKLTASFVFLSRS